MGCYEILAPNKRFLQCGEVLGDRETYCEDDLYTIRPLLRNIECDLPQCKLAQCL